MEGLEKSLREQGLSFGFQHRLEGADSPFWQVILVNDYTNTEGLLAVLNRFWLILKVCQEVATAKAKLPP